MSATNQTFTVYFLDMITDLNVGRVKINLKKYLKTASNYSPMLLPMHKVAH